jgi:hypothetical protein
MNRKGFKPKVVQDLLHISDQTFRYWRANLDCLSARPIFSAKDILVYRVFKLLIESRSLRVNYLKKFDRQSLFDWVYVKKYTEMKGYVLVLDDLLMTINFQTTDKIKNPYDINLYFLDLANAVNQHLDAIHNFGD